MISSNLAFVQQFLTTIRNKIDVQEIEKNGISELEVRYNSREFESKLQSGKYDVVSRIDPKVLRNLTSTQKMNIYIMLRLLMQECDSGYLRMVFSDYKEYLTKRTFFNNDRYFYLSSLTDSMFNYEIDTLLWNNKSKRDLYRKLSQREQQQNNKNTFELLEEILSSYQFSLIEKHRPKRVQRHKGYRDHGSLGSDFSKTLKQQANSAEWKEICEKAEKEKQDFLNFLWALHGWI